MSLLQITHKLAINPHEIISMTWDRRHYTNSSRNVLVIRMTDGYEHRIEGDQDIQVYDIEKKIYAALRVNSHVV